ncbi:sigma-70 family RNA polymerase sigma factor [Lysinibacillus cavernae]|uniref:sigma-70 family RNA polymerase sigma factor n=1 Tax=Lysinibacillus cavernae TaxID=2666135 RepID=UPI0012D90418|nr:sigma-70 family RNA polymerase sigma factor [Lysinibacillus cavernae]
MAFQTSKDTKYNQLVLSDITVIKELLTFRGSIDDTNFNQGACATNSLKMNTDVISLFADLDELIKKALNEEQIKLLSYITKDYSYYTIAKVLGIPVKTVGSRFNTICLKIKQENDRQWRKVTYINKLRLKTKRCSKCHDILPATDEFFSLNSSSRDLFHSQCKKCKK